MTRQRTTRGVWRRTFALLALAIVLAGASLVGLVVALRAQHLPTVVLLSGLLGAGLMALVVLTVRRVPRASTTGATLGRRAPRVVAIGGGTGMPSVLRGLKTITRDLTAIVTVGDDGGSSGRLRRDMHTLPPGDLRNNIVALADDESLMARLFQYRFANGELGGHAFGNLFIAALADVVDGGLEEALVETARVLNIQGRVLPSTFQDIHLRADVCPPDGGPAISVLGESAISAVGGHIERMALVPPDAPAYSDSVRAILEADVVVIGPGSLYTSIIPNLLINGIGEALRATRAYILYVCNVATQPGETEGFTVADHVVALEQQVGRGLFQGVIANNATPVPPADSKTFYVPPAPENHYVLQHYDVYYTDLTDTARPWRHDPQKLAAAIQHVIQAERQGAPPTRRPVAPTAAHPVTSSITMIR